MSVEAASVAFALAQKVIEHWADFTKECIYCHETRELLVFDSATSKLEKKMHVDDDLLYETLDIHGYYRDLKDSAYGMSKVMGLDQDKLDLQPVKAKPAPFFATWLSIELFKHQDSDKEWAISKCGTHAFSLSDRSFGTWMHFKYTSNKSRTERIDEKIKEGYTSIGMYTFDPITRMPEPL